MSTQTLTRPKQNQTVEDKIQQLRQLYAGAPQFAKTALENRVGTVHDMRFVFLDNDTKLLFATAYDGDWDAYIEDFVAKIPNEMDVLFSAWEGWPGIHSPKVKDWIAKYQITAEGWYVAHPDLTVRDIHRVKRVGKAVEEFLDKIG